jgi:hypothetical protein
MKVSDLAELGGTNKVNNSIVLAADGFELDVTFTMPAKLNAGVYQAIVSMGSAPLAIIILIAT